MRSCIPCLVIVGVMSTAGLIIAVGQDRAVEEYMALQGAWQVTAAEQNGKPFDAVKGGVLTITDRSFDLRTTAGSEFSGELRLNPSTSSGELDFVNAAGATVWEGNYTADGDVLRINYVEAAVHDGRPPGASSADSPGLGLVMHRVPK